MNANGSSENQKLLRLRRLVEDLAVAVRCTRERADKVLRSLAECPAELEQEEGWRRAA